MLQKIPIHVIVLTVAVASQTDRRKELRWNYDANKNPQKYKKKHTFAIESNFENFLFPLLEQPWKTCVRS